MVPDLAEPICSIMADLSAGLHKILTDRLTGVYLGGSTAAGEFSEVSSDLDFLVVTEGALSVEDGLAIGLLHRDLRLRHVLARRLEGDYAPRHLLTPEGTSSPVPGCEHGVFLPRVGEVMLSAENIDDIRSNGIPFFGRPAAEVLPPVTPELIRAAVRRMLGDGLGPCHTVHEAAAEILSLIRSLFALAAGRSATRHAGALWGLRHLDERWHPVIRAALAARSGLATKDDERVIWADLEPIDQALRPNGLA